MVSKVPEAKMSSIGSLTSHNEALSSASCEVTESRSRCSDAGQISSSKLNQSNSETANTKIKDCNSFPGDQSNAFPPNITVDIEATAVTTTAASSYLSKTESTSTVSQGAQACFMCQRPAQGGLQPTLDMLSTVVSKVCSSV